MEQNEKPENLIFPKGQAKFLYFYGEEPKTNNKGTFLNSTNSKPEDSNLNKTVKQNKNPLRYCFVYWPDTSLFNKTKIYTFRLRIFKKTPAGHMYRDFKLERPTKDIIKFKYKIALDISEYVLDLQSQFFFNEIKRIPGDEDHVEFESLLDFINGRLVKSLKSPLNPITSIKRFNSIVNPKAAGGMHKKRRTRKH
jgi:hypothetical protein